MALAVCRFLRGDVAADVVVDVDADVTADIAAGGIPSRLMGTLSSFNSSSRDKGIRDEPKAKESKGPGY